MSSTTSESPKSHLDYYEEHQIAPVSYNMSNMNAHLERRRSLYTLLGLPPVTFKGANVLEIAAGTGHNSLYLAHQFPRKLTLLEPNTTGIKFIHEAYDSFTQPHVKPNIITKKLEDYCPIEKFDIVLCENWLGCSGHEISLLKKLSTFVEAQGVLVVTTVSPIGFVPNLLRRFLSLYLYSQDDSFEVKTSKLIKAFESHLDTLPNMTRTATDWVQDNMLNPIYFDLCLTIPRVIQEIGSHFSAFASSPSFKEDWRWFKDLNSSDCGWNEHFLNQYWSKAHNFLDYRESTFTSSIEQNKSLEASAQKLLEAIRTHEKAYIEQLKIKEGRENVLASLQEFINHIPAKLNKAKKALSDCYQLIQELGEGKQELSQTGFNGLFSRETTYLALKCSSEQN